MENPKQRIDPRLDVRSWSRTKRSTPIGHTYRTEEETANDPADNALWLDGHIARVVEAKKLTATPDPTRGRTCA